MCIALFLSLTSQQSTAKQLAAAAEMAEREEEAEAKHSSLLPAAVLSYIPKNAADLLSPYLLTFFARGKRYYKSPGGFIGGGVLTSLRQYESLVYPQPR